MPREYCRIGWIDPSNIELLGYTLHDNPGMAGEYISDFYAELAKAPAGTNVTPFQFSPQARPLHALDSSKVVADAVLAPKGSTAVSPKVLARDRWVVSVARHDIGLWHEVRSYEFLERGEVEYEKPTPSEYDEGSRVARNHHPTYARIVFLEEQKKCRFIESRGF